MDQYWEKYIPSFRSFLGNGMPGRHRTGLCAVFLALFVTLLLLFSNVCPVFAASPLAGTVIENRATASYRNPVLDRFETMESNPVRIVVQAVESLSLVASQQIFRSPGASFSFSHTLSNTGNTGLSAFITTALAAGNAFPISGISVVRDLNQNGIADSGEPVVPPGGMVGLAIGESVSLVVSGFVPASAMQGQAASLTLRAVSTIQAASAAVIDQVTVSTAALLQVNKQTSVLKPNPGAEVTFSLIAINNGSGTALGTSPPGGQQLLVDGVVKQLVLLRDVIPAGTAYVPGSLARLTEGALLYHKTGDPPYSYLTSEPLQVDEIACGIANLPVGKELNISFRVRVNSNASGNIVNTSPVLYQDGVSPLPVESLSNTVTLTLPALPPTITFYNTNSFATPAQAAHLGSLLYLQADASACNTNPAVVEQRTIVITSALSGDEESFTSTETGLNTGIFRILDIQTRDAATNVVVKGDSIIEARRHDVLTATISGCGSSSVSARLLIDPGGVVFDSRSNLPVANASVTLIDIAGAGNGGAAGQPARVFDLDGITPLPSTVVTGPTGSFDFPLVLPSNYALSVVAPNGWTFPSALIQTQLPGSRVIHANGSYGKVFPVNAITGPVYLDVPIDPGPAAGLFVQKSASRTTAEIADVVDYTVRVKNSSGKLLKSVTLNDNLPFGFSYQKGTARRDGAVAADPGGGHGPGLVFRLDDMADGSIVQITYRVKIGPGAMRSDGVNRAQAFAPYGTSSNVASAVVRLEQGVFTDKGIVLGKVFVDCDRDRLQGDKEPGIPGVRIYMEDGTYVVTDSEGKYSFYGVSPRTHVLNEGRKRVLLLGGQAKGCGICRDHTGYIPV